jgi:hypothetical protein
MRALTRTNAAVVSRADSAIRPQAAQAQRHFP